MIVVSVLVLIATVVAAMFVSRTSVFGLDQTGDATLPDTIFLGIGATIGAAGGALQTASRTMMVRQAAPGRMTESFGLYALSGKATAFIAPLSVGIATSLTGSQQWGISPLVALFATGLFLLYWVKPEGERSACAS